MTTLESNKTLKETLELKRNPDVFYNRESAFRWAERCVKSKFIILGSNNQFWGVCGTDANRLLKQGFEFAI